MNFHGSEFNLKLEKTMKKYFVYIASAVLMMAACAKEEVNTPVETPVVGETELITVELNAATKTALDGTNTKWSAGDAVSVNFGGTSIGTLTLVEGNTFSGEITKGKSGAATLTYPAGVTAVPTTQKAVAGSFANGAALLEGKTTIEDLRAGNGTELQNKTALLEFSVAKAGDVTFEVGSTKYTVTGCKTGKTYYACVAPATAKLTARIDGYLSKNTTNNKTFTASKIADLGELPAPAKSTIELRGDAPLSWNSGTQFYKDVDCCVLKNVSLASNQGFKIVNSGKWLQGNIGSGKWAVLKENGNNMTTSTGQYDIYVSNTGKVLKVVSAGSPSPEVIKPESDYMYLLPSDNWLESSAHFVAWLWKDSGSGKVYNFSEHPDVSGLYRVKLNGANKMILFRLPSNITYGDASTTWPGDNTNWHKTGDLSISNKNLYTVVNWHESGSGLSNVTTLL